MPECMCGEHVSARFARVYGPEEDLPGGADVSACYECSTRSAISEGAASTVPSQTTVGQEVP